MIWEEILCVDRVGRLDNFFELGGDSVLAVKVLEKIHHAGMSAQFYQLFEHPVLSELGAVLERIESRVVADKTETIARGTSRITPEMVPLATIEQHQIDRIADSVSGGALNIKDIYPLTASQEGIFFNSLLDEERGDTDILQTLLSLPSHDAVDRLTKALQSVIDRHDVLRSSITGDTLSRPLQVVHRTATLQTERLELRADQDFLSQLEEHMKPDKRRMDLHCAPLMHVQTVSDAKSGKWYAVLKLHHLVCDQKSFRRLIAEVMSHLEGRALELPEPLPYRVHVEKVLQAADTNEARAFFTEKLASINESVVLFGLPDFRKGGGRMEEARQFVDGSLGRRIRNEAQRRGIVPAALFHAAWGLLVSRCSGREEIVFGTVLLDQCQGEESSKRMLGAFVNTLPLRLRLEGFSVEELINQTHQELTQLLSHSQTPLAVAQRCSGVGATAPLFGSLLNYHSRLAETDQGGSGVADAQVIAVRAWTNYPISMSVDDRRGDGFFLSAQTDNRLQPTQVMGYFRTALEQMVEALEKEPQRSLSRLSILTHDEREYLVYGLNATEHVGSTGKMVHELFEEQVRTRGLAIAVICGTYRTSYIELNSRANRLARYLRGKGLESGEYVPIAMSRSLDLLIAELAVLKGGGTFVPIDPTLPLERRAFMIRDSGARRIISDRPFEQELGIDPQHWLCAAEELDWQRFPDNDLHLPLNALQPAYVMYTSGSTGSPKGVVIPHRAIPGLVVGTRYIQIGPDDCVVHCSNPAFDASTFEVWGALLNGACMLIVPQSTLLETEGFAQMLKQQGATVMLLTTALFNRFVATTPHMFEEFRYLLFGGEIADPNAVRTVVECGRPIHLLNVYGPTETTTFATSYEVQTVSPESKTLPIGRTVGNTRIYILDRHLQPAPMGVVGEICIGGVAVANGYLRRPELTAERFIADQFGSDPNGRIYRSGDVGLWREDGTVEYLGRKDQQVKLRGLRIELGEIEGQLLRDHRIREAVVVAREDVPGEKYLAAYVTLAPTASVLDEALPISEEFRTQLKATLPEYMVPATFVVLLALPLTANGKIDRRALPIPELGSTARRFEPPQGQTEEILAGIWQSVLHLNRIGRQDSFFDLGGQSLLAMSVITKVRQAFGVLATPSMLFSSPSLEGFAESLDTLLWLRQSASPRGRPAVTDSRAGVL